MEMVEKILEAIKNNDTAKTGIVSGSIGIRTTDAVYNVGDELPKSYDWTADERELLDGTCATGFGCLWLDGEEEDIETVEKALEIHSQYYGEHMYLIGGIDSEYGYDQGEIIIEGAEVMAVLR